MANDFSGDADCVALFRFENGALTTDSIGGNTLTAVNTPVADLGDFKEGAASCDFEKADDDAFLCTNANLDADFPGKSGNANKDYSACVWVKFESLPVAASPDFNYSIICGIMTSPKYSWQVRIKQVVAGPGPWQQNFVMGTPGGAGTEEFNNAGRNLSVGVWYHMGWTYQDSDKSYQMRLYDTSNSTGYTATGNFTNNMNVEDAGFDIGRSEGAALAEMDGLMDELVIRKDVLSIAEIDSIRDGTFGAPAGGAGGIAIIGSDF